jgi:hypothetical protein
MQLNPFSGRGASPYQIPGRLNDVIAAVTVMAAHADSTMYIEKWVDQLSKVEPGAVRDRAIRRWTQVFEGHPEFFIVYTLPTETQKKAALRLRYANKTIDPDTKKEPVDFKALTDAQRGRLISMPLSEGLVNSLVATAINMHAAAIARNADRRYWIPIATSVLGLIGALVGSLLAPYITKSDKPAEPMQVQLIGPPAAPSPLGRK